VRFARNVTALRGAGLKLDKETKLLAYPWRALFDFSEYLLQRRIERRHNFNAQIRLYADR
jgi:hypothetical protein